MMTRKVAGAHFGVFIVLTFGALALASSAQAGPLTDKGTQPGLTHPLEESGNCSLCHAGYDVLHVEPWDTWAGTMMAQSSRDPLFWAALDVANNDVPGAGDFCLRCHVSRGWLAGRSEPPGGSVDGCGLVGNLDERDNDFDGVTCDLCHRMKINDSPPPGEQTFYTESGQFWLDDGDCGGVPCRRGPYDYPGPELPPHTWMYSAYHEDSVICGTCHNVTNPLETLIDGGVDTGIPFPVERTYMEWTESSFSILGPGFKTCQNCHMPDAQEDPVYASSFAILNRTGDMPIHRLVGGNAWIPDVLRQEYPNLFLSDSLTETRDAAIAFLQNETATVEVTLLGPASAGGTMDVEVKVTNLSGHKLPTGYSEGRRMWLNLQARDGLDQPIWESGAYDASTGVLTKDGQIKIYHTEHGIWDYNGTNACDTADALGRPMFHFVLGNCIAVDNRIPPEGFAGASNPETQPVAYTYPETFPGSGVLVNYDVTPYSVPIPMGVVQPVTVTATLYYQTASKDYIDFLVNEAVENLFADDCIPRTTGLPGMTRAELLEDMWQAYGRSAPIDVDADTQLAAADADGDGFSPPTDCDDDDDTVYPGAPEVCDNKDNDCDGSTDEGNPGGGGACSTGLPGICGAGILQCTGGALVCQQINNPTAEICNDADDDCNGVVDDGNPGGGAACETGLFGVCSDGTAQCQAGNLVCEPDAEPQAEQCDGLDEDCDGVVDNGNPGGGGACSTGLPGVCDAGILQCMGGAVVCEQTSLPEPEICGNGIDEDCDGGIDEAEDCSLCLPENTSTLPTQTTRTIIKLLDGVARDKVIVKGAFVMPSPTTSAPDTEELTVIVADESGNFYQGTIPSGSFESRSGGKKYLYKDRTRPYELDGVKIGKFARRSDGITLKYTIKAQDLDQPAFNGTTSTVTMKIGDWCYTDSGDLCTVSGSGKVTKCR